MHTPTSFSNSVPYQYLAVTTLPSITSINVSTGPTTGGTQLTLTGTGFTGVSAVNFGTIPAASFTFISDTLITVTSPAQAAGTVHITVTTPGGTSTPGTADQFTYTSAIHAPTVNGISPTQGPITGGTTVTITGAGFSQAPITNVLFGASPAVIVTQPGNNDTTFQVIAPAHAAGTVDITVSNSAGTSAINTNDSYLYTTPQAPPAVSSLSPASGPIAGGNQVIITGSGFTGTTNVFFGSNPASFTVSSDLQISAVAPAGVAGTVDVTVQNSIATSPTNTGDQYLYQPPATLPAITGLIPSSGPIAGGTSVTIIGSGFTGATQVLFGTTPGTSLNPLNDGFLTVIAPAQSAGQVDVRVVTPAGSSPLTAFDQYSYLTPPSAPSISGINPASGPLGGTNTVTVFGTGFTGTTVVIFGPNAPALSFQVQGDTQLTAIVPPVSAPTVVDIQVGNQIGLSPLTPVAAYTYGTPTTIPVISQVTPNQGPTTGGNPVTILGSGFSTMQRVLIGGVPAPTVTIQSDTVLQITIPPLGPGTYDIQVFNANGASVPGPSDRYTVVAITAPAVVQQLSPNSGPASGNLPVQIIGSGFTGITAVWFGGSGFAAQFTPVNPNLIAAVAPPHPAGVVDVQVVNSAGPSVTNPGDAFTYVPTLQAPIVQSIAPSQGPVTGGTFVTITGSGFQAATGVSFGGVPAASYTVLPDNDTIMTAVSPPSPQPQAVDIQVGSALGFSNTSPGDIFRYVQPGTSLPVISSISPPSGSVNGNQFVQIIGSGFTGAMDVRFGVGFSSPNINIISDSLIVAATPAHPAGPVDVQVSNALGYSVPAPTDSFLFIGNVSSSTIQQIGPNSGPSTGGTSLLINGQGFTGTTQVLFGGAPAAFFSVIDDGDIFAITPASPNPSVPTLAVDVQVCSNGGCSPPQPPDVFTFGQPPAVSGLNPISGPTSGGNQLTINGQGFTSPNIQVFFDGIIAAQVQTLSPTQLTVEVPPHPPGSAQVAVVVGQTVTTQANYNYIAVPVGGPQSPATPCTLSRLYDRTQILGTPGGTSAIPDSALSLCDRVPAGKYVLVRNALPLGQVVSQAAQWQIRGLVFLVSDETGGGRVTYAPSPVGTPWQQWQAQLAADQITAPPQLGQLSGPQSLRHAGPPLVAGGLVILRQAAFNNPVGAAISTAIIRNNLSLDFILVDVDDPIWNGPNAGSRLLQFAQMFHQQTLRSAMPPDLLTVSQHVPLFLGLNASPGGFVNLLAPDGVLEALVNGYSGPKTIAAPRIPAGTPAQGLVTAWQWARPLDSGGTGMNHCEMIVDVHNGVNPGGTVSALVAPDSLSVTFLNQPGTWTVNSGVVFYDDYTAILPVGPAGNPPVGYWDYDKITPVVGALVPSFFPDPPPLAQTNRDWAFVDPITNVLEHFTLSFENWKTGHLRADNAPAWVTITDPSCGQGDTIPVLPTWISLNNTPLQTTGAGPLVAQRALLSNQLAFSGVPLSGDDGSYLFLITAQRAPNDPDLTTNVSFVLQVTDPSRLPPSPIMSSTGVPIPRPDVQSGGPAAAAAGSLHSIIPRQLSTGRIPLDWPSPQAWCVGVKNVSALQNSPLAPMPLPPRQRGTPPTPQAVCGFNYLPQVIQGYVGACQHTANGGALSICNSPANTGAYAGFVFATIAALSGWNPSYTNASIAGLMGQLNQAPFNTGNPLDPAHDLFIPSVVVDSTANLLANTWGSTTGIDCLGQPYDQQVTHAYLSALCALGNYPSSCPGQGTCGQVPLNNNLPPPGLPQVAGMAACFAQAYNATSISPFAPPTNNGYVDPLTVCELIQAAYAAGFRDDPSRGRYGAAAETELVTIVAIALAESGGSRFAHNPCPAVSPGCMSWGPLQINVIPDAPVEHPTCNTVDCATDPYRAFAIAYSDPSLAHCNAAIPNSCQFGCNCVVPPGTNPGIGVWAPYYNGLCTISQPFGTNNQYANSYCAQIPLVRQVLASGSCPLTPSIPYNPPPPTSGGAPQTTLGCPVPIATEGFADSVNSSITSTCAWHLQNEGLLAVDIATTGYQNPPIYATCDGVITSKGWDNPNCMCVGDSLCGVAQTPCNTCKVPWTSGCPDTGAASSATRTCCAGGYGVTVVIQCNSNPLGNGPMFIRYGHMDPRVLTDSGYPNPGDPVATGQKIGLMSSTGNSTGQHVHYEISSGGLGSQFTVCPTGEAVPGRASPLASPLLTCVTSLSA